MMLPPMSSYSGAYERFFFKLKRDTQTFRFEPGSGYRPNSTSAPPLVRRRACEIRYTSLPSLRVRALPRHGPPTNTFMSGL